MATAERSIQASVRRLLLSAGAAVYTIGTTRRRQDHPGTMQTSGLPDLVAFVPRRGTAAVELLMIEVKSAGGRLRPEQARFRELCLVADVAHVVGGVDAVLAWLEKHGYVRSRRDEGSSEPEHPSGLRRTS